MSTGFSVSTIAFSGHSFGRACEVIASCGCRHVEPAYIEGYGQFDESELDSANALSLRSQAEAVGLSCRSVSAHVDTGAPDAVDRMKRRIDFAAALGARYLISNAGAVGTERVFVANMEEIGEFAARRDVVVCLENPGHGTSLFADAAAMLGWKKRFGHPAIDLNYDFGNAFTASNEQINPAVDGRALIGSAAHFHLKDVISDSAGWHISAIGDGALDYGAILADIAATRPDAALTIETPLRLWRPQRGDAQFKSPPPLAEIERQLRRSITFVNSGVQALKAH